MLSCSVLLQRVNPIRRRDKVYIGCGAGFSGDRPRAAFKLLQSVKELNYIVLECLAERTLADRYKEMMSGGDGYDPRSMFFCIYWLLSSRFYRLCESDLTLTLIQFDFIHTCSFGVDAVALASGYGKRNMHYYKYGCK